MAWKTMSQFHLLNVILAICILASILILLGQPPVYRVPGLWAALTDLSSSPSPDRENNLTWPLARHGTLS
jgi:hypothetical protein